MSVALRKGGNVPLPPAAARVRVALGWNDAAVPPELEVDGVVTVVEREPAVLLAHQVPNRAERPGAAAPPRPLRGDADTLVVTLGAVPAAVERLQVGAAIYDAAGRRQAFRAVPGAYVRVLDDASGEEIASYAVEPETGRETAMVFGELYRHGGGWKFRAVGQGYAAGLAGLTAGEPAPARPVDVVGFLARTSPARARRNLADHLHPPPPPAAGAPPAAGGQPSGAGPAAGAGMPSRSSGGSAGSGPAAGAGRPRLDYTRADRAAASPPRPAPAGPPPGRAPAPAGTGGSPPGRAPAGAGRSPLDLGAPADRAAAPPARGRSSLDLGGAGDAPPRPASGGSPLDLGGPAAEDGPPHGYAAPRRRAPVEPGERSSRVRQRQEHVTALDGDHPVTTWTAAERGSGAMTVTLRWERLRTASGLPRPSDVHLGAFWQADDGDAGLVQSAGDLVRAPGGAAFRTVLRLGGRDEEGGETIFVDAGALMAFKRFFVFVYGMHGVPEWALLRPVLEVSSPAGSHLAIRPGDAPPDARLCVLASFHVVGDDLVIRREDDFLAGTQSAAAPRYGWSFEWEPDGTTPRAAG